MSVEKLSVSLKKFDKLLMQEITVRTIPIEHGLVIRNLVFASDEVMFDKFKKLALALLLTKQLGENVNPQIISYIKKFTKSKWEEGEKPFSDFVKGKDSKIEFDVHPLFRSIGRCFICGAELINKISKEEGIGPICKKKMQGGFESPLSSEDKMVAGYYALNGSNFKFSRFLGKKEDTIMIMFNNKKPMWASIKGLVYYKDALLVAPWYWDYFTKKFSTYDVTEMRT